MFFAGFYFFNFFKIFFSCFLPQSERIQRANHRMGNWKRSPFAILGLCSGTVCWHFCAFYFYFYTFYCFPFYIICCFFSFQGGHLATWSANSSGSSVVWLFASLFFVCSYDEDAQGPGPVFPLTSLLQFQQKNKWKRRNNKMLSYTLDYYANWWHTLRV